MDFSNAEYSTSSIIPAKTIVKVCMNIKPGYCNDEPSVGNTDDYATRAKLSDAVYLNCEFTVVEGEYKGCKFFDIIGLHSPKGSLWADMGRSTIKGILASARRINPKDKSPQAQQAFNIKGYGDLDGITFLAAVKSEDDDNGNERNKLLKPIAPDHKDYAVLMGSTHNAYSNTPQQQQQPHPQTRYQETSSVVDSFDNDEIPF